MKTEKLEYRLYGRTVLNWFTNQRGPERVLASVTITVEQSWNEQMRQAEWHRLGGPREFTWDARQPTAITRCAMQSPKCVVAYGKKEIDMPVTSCTVEKGSTMTISIKELVATLR